LLTVEQSISIGQRGLHIRATRSIYPFDYGYLEDTKASDGDGLDCWRGSLGGTEVTGVVAVIDPVKGDSEIKVLLGCTEDDMETILSCHKRGDMNGIVVKKS